MPLTFSPFLRLAVLVLAGWLSGPEPVLAQPTPPDKPEIALASPQALSQGFETGIAQLQENVKTWEARGTAAADKLAHLQEELSNLQVAVASLKANLVLQKPPLPQLQELMAIFAAKEKDLRGRLKDLAREIDVLKQDRQDQQLAQNALRMQLGIIQVRSPGALTPEMQQASLSYLNLAGSRDELAARVQNLLEQRRQLLQQALELLLGLAPQLKQLEEAGKADLLKRPAQAVSFREQVAGAWENLAAVPARVWTWVQELVRSGRLGAFIRQHLAALVGLLGCILLVRWSTRRLYRQEFRRFQAWKAQSADHHRLPFSVLMHVLIGNLFGLGLIFWVGLFCWTFDLLGSDPVQLVLAVLVTVWAVHLSLQWVQGFFAGAAPGGALPLEPEVTRYYRRSLKLFLVYLGLGLFGLRSAGLLGFPESSRLFLQHCFLVGILGGCWWLARRPYLPRLLTGLAGPAWLHRPVVSLFLGGALLFLLVVILLADLLGFQNLAMYLARGAVWNLLAMLVLWFLWLAGEVGLRHLLHPEAGRAAYRYPDRTEAIQRLYMLSRWTLSLVLGVLLALWTLNSWGITLPQVAWAFQLTTCGPALGPVKLTTLNLVGASLVIYGGFFFSRLLRGVMVLRIFPRTALDRGVQYTISTTVHYVILILAAIIALDILGFALMNLVLVLGALGVGIGFGLQNIVNNFLSGLILLFERPVKVGDLLVIDGQWGRVKEIRVRSTIFETFDRCVMVIPNSELVSGKVHNWTHYGSGVNRLTLKVGVSYDADVRQVTKLLTEICRANPRVLDDPPPQVFFAVYGDSSLDFTIWVYLATPGDRTAATHELNSAIFEAFRQHGIEIPFPQRDLHIKELPLAGTTGANEAGA